MRDAAFGGMRITSIVLAAALAVSCGGSSRTAEPPLGVRGHLMEAERCEREAVRHEAVAEDAEAAARPEDRVCSDRVLDDQLRSGGERLLARSPCWSNEEDTADRHRDEAARLRADALAHRKVAQALMDAEAKECDGMPTGELDHTPFAHRADVRAVCAELDGDRLRGARITFATVRGLTAPWLREAIACHQARAAALGWDPQYMGYDPAMVAGASVDVEDDSGQVVVVVTAEDDVAAQAIYGRAEDLLR